MKKKETEVLLSVYRVSLSQHAPSLPLHLLRRAHPCFAHPSTLTTSPLREHITNTVDILQRAHLRLLDRFELVPLVVQRIARRRVAESILEGLVF